MDLAKGISVLLEPLLFGETFRIKL